MGNIKLSVLTYVYCTKNDKRIDYLLEAIKSVKDQNFKHSYEHVIVDDGSDIDVWSKIKNSNSKIRYIKKEHSGIAESFIRTIKEPRGEYSIILASDDIFTKNSLNTLSDHLDSHKDIGIVAGKTMYWDGENNLKMAPFEADYNEHLLLSRNILGACSLMFRTKYLNKIEMPSLKSGIAIDYDLWLRLSEVCKIKSIKFVASKYRLHKTNFQKSSVLNMEERNEQINHAKNSAKKRRGLK